MVRLADEVIAGAYPATPWIANAVVHAFWVSELRVKMYAYPGHVDEVTITVPHPGTWTGRCAQLCGLLHYEMDFQLKAVPPAAFRQFLHAAGATP